MQKAYCSSPCLPSVPTPCGHGGGDTKAEAKDPQTPTVQVVAVTRGTLERLTPAAGTLQSLSGQEASLSPPVSGVLDALLVRYGQTVQKGQMSSVGATVGETVDTTTKIAVIANLSRLQLKISLPEDVVAQVHRGQSLTFTVGGLEGRVFRTSVETIPASRPSRPVWTRRPARCRLWSRTPAASSKTTPAPASRS